MSSRNSKLNKILNVSIGVSCGIILLLLFIFISKNNDQSVMGNSVYNNSHSIGDMVEYAGTDWYVIAYNNKSYTLLKQNALTKREIESLELNIQVTDDGKISYDLNDNCNEYKTDGCSVSLENSLIGRVLSTWQNKYLNPDDLITVGDYTIRLIDYKDIETFKDRDWLYLDNYYWTMYTPNYSGLNVYGLHPDKETYIQMVYDGSNDMSGGLVRPVINVKKSIIK